MPVTRIRREAMRTWIAAGVAVGLLAVEFASHAGALLVVDEAKPSDVVLVLAGETENRPERALALLRAGFGRRIILDVPNGAVVYGVSQIELAKQYVQRLP